MANEIEADVKSSYRAWRLRIFAITWMSYAGFYLTRKSFSVAKIKLLPDDDEAARNEMLGQFAVVDGVYLTAYALGQFVWGMSGDRFGTRRVILFGMFASVVTAIAMGASSMIILGSQTGENLTSCKQGYKALGVLWL